MLWPRISLQAESTEEPKRPGRNYRRIATRKKRTSNDGSSSKKNISDDIQTTGRKSKKQDGAKPNDEKSANPTGQVLCNQPMLLLTKIDSCSETRADRTKSDNPDGDDAARGENPRVHRGTKRNKQAQQDVAQVEGENRDDAPLNPDPSKQESHNSPMVNDDESARHKEMPQNNAATMVQLRKLLDSYKEPAENLTRSKKGRFQFRPMRLSTVGKRNEIDEGRSTKKQRDNQDGRDDDGNNSRDEERVEKASRDNNRRGRTMTKSIVAESPRRKVTRGNCNSNPESPMDSEDVELEIMSCDESMAVNVDSVQGDSTSQGMHQNFMPMGDVTPILNLFGCISNESLVQAILQGVTKSKPVVTNFYGHVMTNTTTTTAATSGNVDEHYESAEVINNYGTLLLSEELGKRDAPGKKFVFNNQGTAIDSDSPLFRTLMCNMSGCCCCPSSSMQNDA